MTTTPPILTSRTIGETENALRAILQRTLAGTELDYHRWVALKLVSEGQQPTSKTGALVMLENGLKIDHTSAVAVIDELVDTGHILIETGGHLTPTPEGTSLYERLNDQIRQLAERVWAGLETEDLVTAQRVLTTITERANHLLAS